MTVKGARHGAGGVIGEHAFVDSDLWWRPGLGQERLGGYGDREL